MVIGVALLWLLFAPGTGVVALLKKREELRGLQQKTVQLEEDNAKLEQDIERLQNDAGYLEEIARKEYGLLRKNEQVYDFSPKKPARQEE